MRKRLLKQAGICLLMVLTILVSSNSGITVLEKGTHVALMHISANYSIDDVKAVADKGIMIAASATGKIENAVSVITGKPIYGEPIDKQYDGEKTPVYAVAGGQVAAIGENEEIGKYVRLLHGNQAESLYGNLQSIKVNIPSNVKKGQIIGIYEKNEEKEFYYSLKEKE